jgi:hypothetical protein
MLYIKITLLSTVNGSWYLKFKYPLGKLAFEEPA